MHVTAREGTQIHIERIMAILLDPRTWQHKLDQVKKSMSATPKTKSVREEEERQNLSQVSKTNSASKKKKGGVTPFS
jgi:hypothetical protein